MHILVVNVIVVSQMVLKTYVKSYKQTIYKFRYPLSSCHPKRYHSKNLNNYLHFVGSA